MAYIGQVTLPKESARESLQSLMKVVDSQKAAITRAEGNKYPEEYDECRINETLLRFSDVHAGSIEYKEACDGRGLELRLQGTTTNPVELIFQDAVLSHKIPTITSVRLVVQEEQGFKSVSVHYKDGHGSKYTNSTAVSPLDTETEEVINILYETLESIYQTMKAKHGEEKIKESIFLEDDDVKEIIAQRNYPLVGSICLN